MKLTSFITVYKMKKTDEDRINEVKKHIKNEYIPYEKKADVAKAIVEASCYVKDDNGHRVLKINSVAKYMLECMSIVDLFTDFERSKQDGKTLDEYNILNSSGLLDIIIMCSDQKQLKELHMLVDMTYEDLIANEYEPHAFFKNQINRFGDLFMIAIKPVLDQLDMDKITELIGVNNVE